MREAVVTPDSYLNEIASHLIVAGGKRLRPVLAVAAAQVLGAPASYDVVRGGVVVRARAPRLALPRRRDGRGRHPPRCRDGQREMGQPAGDPRRRLPPRPCVGDRCVARHRGRRSAGPHHRLAVRRPDRRTPPHLRHHPDRGAATSPRSTARPPRCTAPRPASAASSPGHDRVVIDALTEYGNAYGTVFQIVDDILDVTATDEQLGKPSGHDMIEGVYTLPVLRTLALGNVVGGRPRRTARHTARPRPA